MIRQRRSLEVAALFAGIGGLDLGLERSGHRTAYTSEVDPLAAQVLRRRLPAAEELGDILALKSLPKVDLVTGGFPCQDISLAGTRAGLEGRRSGLVWKMFDLLAGTRPELVLLENVSNLLRLKSGAAMLSILDAFTSLGYRWAYRLVDTRGFGLPQRRLRVLILASRGEVDPADILFRREKQPLIDDEIRDPSLSSVYGFYWTEGRRGVGWARDSVPTIKGGSGLGIPSPPAIYFPRRRIAGTMSLEDAERLQGFPVGWTKVTTTGGVAPRAGARWRLLGNAVSVPVSRWIGTELARYDGARFDGEATRWSRGALPSSAMSCGDALIPVRSTTHVVKDKHEPLRSFLRDEVTPLSAKALTGYLHRVATGDKVLPDRFVRDLKYQLRSGRHS